MARTGGKLTAKQLSDLLKPYTNSNHHEKLQGSGFFDKISGIIDKVAQARVGKPVL